MGDKFWLSVGVVLCIVMQCLLFSTICAGVAWLALGFVMTPVFRWPTVAFWQVWLLCTAIYVLTHAARLALGTTKSEA